MQVNVETLIPLYCYLTFSGCPERVSYLYLQLMSPYLSEAAALAVKTQDTPEFSRSRRRMRKEEQDNIQEAQAQSLERKILVHKLLFLACSCFY